MTGDEGTDRLRSKRALVTGAGSGIGKGIAERFLADGAVVVGLDRDAGRLAAAADELGGGFTAVRADVTDEAQMADAIATAAADGPLDIVVANAGTGSFGPIVDTELAEWQRIIDVCLTGVFLTIKHAAPAMADGGSLVAIASMNAEQPAAGLGSYCAAKAGVVQLARVAAMELGSRGIRVNAVNPGIIATPLTGPMLGVDGVEDQFVDNMALDHPGTPADVAAVVAFLASDDAAWVTGSAYEVDGGGNTGRYPRFG